jgi:hypothetical protein
MALKILKAEEPITVNQLVLVVYGSPGLGKTTLGFTAEKPILLDFDRGAYRAANRGDSVQVESWADVADIEAEDLAPFKTVVVDTAGRALDFLTVDIIKKNAKHGNGGALTLQGYGVLKSRFSAWLNMIKLMGKDVVLIAHSSEDKKGDDIIERLDVQGGSKGEIYKSADAMGRLYLVNGKRTLSFSPTDTAFGKNPGCLEALRVPEVTKDPLFLAGVTHSIKDKLNAMSDEQLKQQSQIADWMTVLAEAKEPEHFNQLINEVKGADKTLAPRFKGALHKAATEAGMTFDKAQAQYVRAA